MHFLEYFCCYIFLKNIYLVLKESLQKATTTFQFQYTLYIQHTFPGSQAKPIYSIAQLDNQNLLCYSKKPSLFKGQFQSLQSAPREVMEPPKCAPPSFGAMQPVPCFLMETQFQGQNTHKNHLKLGFILIFKCFFFVNDCCFRDLYNQCDIFLWKKYFTRWYL